MANEIDELMSLDPLEMTPENIDSIIAYHRKNRALSESGVKPKKETGPKTKVDLEALGLIKAKPTPPSGSTGGRRF